jgi:hypothetical protein
MICVYRHLPSSQKLKKLGLAAHLLTSDTFTKRRFAMGSALRDELKKKGPFASMEQEGCLNIIRTSDQLQNHLGKLFRDFNISSSQYNVLRLLRSIGEPMQVHEVCERMTQVVPAMTDAFLNLVLANLIELANFKLLAERKKLSPSDIDPICLLQKVNSCSTFILGTSPRCLRRARVERNPHTR